MILEPAPGASSGPALAPVRPSPSPGSTLRRRQRLDRLARGVVSLGGVAIICCILAILLVIVGEVLPLFRGARADAVGRPMPTGGSGLLALEVDDHRTLAFVADARGLRSIPLPVEPGVQQELVGAEALRGARVVAVARFGTTGFALGLSDGRVLPVEARVNIAFVEGARVVTPAPRVLAAAEALPEGGEVRRFAHAAIDAGSITAVARGPRELTLVVLREKKSLAGAGKAETVRREVSLPIEGEATALALDDRGEDLFVGTSCGHVVRVDLRKPKAPAVSPPVRVGPAAVTALGFLIGDRTLVVGDAEGAVGTWQVVHGSESGARLSLVRRFERHAAAVTAVAACRRNKGFVTGDARGSVRLHYGTTGMTLLERQTGEPVVALSYAPKADAVVAADASGRVHLWTVDNPHPEVTFDSLFAPVRYEGYATSEHVWQSTGGTDDFESKFGLMPLIFGTLKGTFYALLFAVPVALLGALYASQFMSPSWRGNVKPVIEIMSALPSVVLGFVAGLWLAPVVERALPAVFLLPFVGTVFLLLAQAGWRRLPDRPRRALPKGGELLLLVPLVLLAGAVSLWLGGWVEAALLGSDPRTWLREALGLTYDQRNSIVVGMAMGFAVVPIIFTIADDALTNVPPHLAAGSLALGATPWQTVLGVVLPAASPGIFSAVMVGFGRAVGETMIVLMATGNTPILDASIFNGFRALSANIAVELPEAPEGSTHFRVLFLAALLLFGLTFLVNTIAEVVRIRLRRRYSLL